MTENPRCRKCGCYDYVHHRLNADYRVTAGHRFSRATRIELWFKDHDTIWAHVKAWAWLNVRTSKSRMDYLDRLYKRRPDLCWCDLVDSYWRAEPSWRSDYRKPHGCICDFPMPRHAHLKGEPRSCYCTWTEDDDA